MANHGGSSVQGQLLNVTVAGCFNLRDTEWFSRQDPYVVLEYSGQKFRTRTDTNGGKNPSFNETFKIPLIEGLREINATVWNSNTIDRDSYIGSTKILLNRVIESGYDDTQWPLTNSRSRKSSGTLKLNLHYDGAKNKPGISCPHAAASTPAVYDGNPPAAYPPAVPAYGAAPPAVPPYGAAPQYAQQQPEPYPPAPIYQAPPPVAYPPAPMGAYGAPPPPQSSYYPPPPAYGAAPAPPYQAYPPDQVYPPAVYATSAYPPYS